MDILIQTYLKPLAGMNSFQILGILFGFGFLASQAIQRMVCLQQSGKYIKENRPLWDDGILPFLSFLLLLIFGLIVGIQYAME